MSTFDSLGLSEKILKSIAQLGFITPTPIQEKVIPVLLQQKHDLVALAQTGTGKTAAFGLPLIDLCDDKNKTTQALILAPTRELCMQITKDLVSFCENVKPYNIVSVYGGASIMDQIRQIKRGAQIIVATPGRLIDLMERKAINISAIKYFVLDEADEMLNMGFQEAIDNILTYAPAEKSVWLFSATMPREVRSIANNYMHNAIEISVGGFQKGNENITHQYMLVNERDRYEALKRVLDYNVDIFCLVFCRTKIDTQEVADKLMKDGYNANALHGDLSQNQRDAVMKSFRDKTLQALVATDVAARGIDVQNISHVINVNLPDEMENYLHRSGRTARAGRTGISLALVTKRELYKIRQIEKINKVEFERVDIPTGTEVCKKLFINLVRRLREVHINEEEIKVLLPEVYKELLDLDKEEIIKRFTSLEFNHLLDYYRDKDDLNVHERDNQREKYGREERGGRYDRKERSNGESRYKMGDRMFINLGKKDGLDIPRFLSLIHDRSGVRGERLGKIDLKGVYSFFDAESDVANVIIKSLHGTDYKGRFIRIEKTSGDEHAGYPKNEERKSAYKGKKEFDKKKSFGDKKDFKKKKKY
ncbi:MAG: DEAD/DEAH box helicase [Fimbriimonadaceae bacterium]|nr:DEAD/DEAH box helicase [Chitinophagales bacterium]